MRKTATASAPVTIVLPDDDGPRTTNGAKVLLPDGTEVPYVGSATIRMSGPDEFVTAEIECLASFDTIEALGRFCVVDFEPLTWWDRLMHSVKHGRAKKWWLKVTGRWPSQVNKAAP